MATSIIPIKSTLKKIMIDANTDLNDCTDENVLYYIKGANMPINAPRPGTLNPTYNASIWCRNYGAYKVQFYASYNQKTVFYRFCETTTWTPWVLKPVVRGLSDGTTYIDIFDSVGNGIILGVSVNGISAYKQVDGVQTILFQNH